MSIQRQTAEERCSLLQKLVGFSIPDYKRIAERESGDFRENLGRISRGFSVSTNRIFACRLCPTLQPTTKPLSTIQRKEEESNERDLTDVWSRRYWVYTLPPGRTTLANDERGRLLLYTIRGWQYHPRMMLIDVDAGNAGSCANRINTPYFDGPMSINI